jgi:hypothetical protein
MIDDKDRTGDDIFITLTSTICDRCGLSTILRTCQSGKREAAKYS